MLESRGVVRHPASQMNISPIFGSGGRAAVEISAVRRRDVTLLLFGFIAAISCVNNEICHEEAAGDIESA